LLAPLVEPPAQISGLLERVAEKERRSAALEAELGFPIAREVIDANVVRALGMKLVKLSAMPLERHPWQTYWLIF
jgi:hypothetical protein